MAEPSRTRPLLQCEEMEHTADPQLPHVKWEALGHTKKTVGLSDDRKQPQDSMLHKGQAPRLF